MGYCAHGRAQDNVSARMRSIMCDDRRTGSLSGDLGTEMTARERFAAWVLRVPLAWGVIGLCVLQLATWIPHFLTWPWIADHDVFATLALAWDSGVLPYRDLAGNNFPGTIYLFWVLGKLFGWGRTFPF